jgi:hypothetical protein
MSDMDTTCIFCSKGSAEVGPMGKGLEDAYICGACLSCAKKVAVPRAFLMGKCAFCGRKITSDEHYIEGVVDVFMCFACTRTVVIPASADREVPGG